MAAGGRFGELLSLMEQRRQRSSRQNPRVHEIEFNLTLSGDTSDDASEGTSVNGSAITQPTMTSTPKMDDNKPSSSSSDSSKAKRSSVASNYPSISGMRSKSRISSPAVSPIFSAALVMSTRLEVMSTRLEDISNHSPHASPLSPKDAPAGVSSLAHHSKSRCPSIFAFVNTASANETSKTLLNSAFKAAKASNTLPDLDEGDGLALTSFQLEPNGMEEEEEASTSEGHRSTERARDALHNDSLSQQHSFKGGHNFNEATQLFQEDTLENMDIEHPVTPSIRNMVLMTPSVRESVATGEAVQAAPQDVHEKAIKRVTKPASVRIWRLTRRRIPPCQWWLGERPLYVRDPITGLDDFVGISPIVNPPKYWVRKKPKRRKKPVQR